jgi:hypothetical protein
MPQENMMRLKTLALAFAIGAGALTTQTSFADTLTLKSTGTQTAGNDYIYPYNMSINGSSQTTAMMCLNYSDEVTIGETWQVQSQQLSTASSTQLQEDAWLFSKASTYGNLDVQLAVWYILDPSVQTNSAWDSSVEFNLISMAQNAVPGLTNGFLSQYTIFSPVLSNQTGWTAGTPQSYIANSVAATPEPSSFLLLGTGLLGSGGFFLRRRSLQEQGAESV